MSTIHVGTINLQQLRKKIRGAPIVQTGGFHSSKKGKRGYDRKRDKRSWRQNTNTS